MVTRDEFLARLDRSGGPDACWPYVGARNQKGYGRLRFEGRTQTASRVAYVLFVGPIPDGHMVLHACDNPPCCNPGDLFTGTGFDNMRDAAAKGRLVPQLPERVARGERVNHAKLTAEQVSRIRAMTAAGTTQAALAAEYGLHPSTISEVVRRLTWAHVG